MQRRVLPQLGLVEGVVGELSIVFLELALPIGDEGLPHAGPFGLHLPLVSCVQKDEIGRQLIVVYDIDDLVHFGLHSWVVNRQSVRIRPKLVQVFKYQAAISKRSTKR